MINSKIKTASHFREAVVFSKNVTKNVTNPVNSTSNYVTKSVTKHLNFGINYVTLDMIKI